MPAWLGRVLGAYVLFAPPVWLGLIFAGVLAFAGILAKNAAAMVWHKPQSHGSARFATLSDARRGKLLSSKGLILGRKHEAALLGALAPLLTIEKGVAVPNAAFRATV